MVSSLSRATTWPLLAAVALAFAGCQPKLQPNDPAFVVAQTSDFTVTRAQLDHEIDQTLKESGSSPAQIGPAHMPAVETAILRRLVVGKLLTGKAEAKNYKGLDKLESDALARIKGQFPSDQVYQDKLKQTGMTEDDLKKQIHNRALIEKYFENEVFKDTEPTEKEVNDFYLGHPNLFQVPLKLRASTVLVIVDEKATPAQKAAAKKKIDAARTRIAKGESFSKVATEVSDDKYTGPKGGDTGYFQRGENEAEFDDVAFASKVGVISPVFTSPLGYHFLEVTEIKPAGIAPIDDMRPLIVENLRKMKMGHQEQAYAEQLIKDSKVTYNIPLTEMPTGTNAAPMSNEGQPSPSAPPEPANVPADTTPPVTNVAPAP